MMEKKHRGLLLGICILLVSASPAVSVHIPTPMESSNQPSIEWEKTYGTTMVDWGRCIQQTTDGGYIITGAYDRNVYTPWQGYVYLLKIDDEGAIKWDRHYGIVPNENVGSSVRQTTDGGYIIAGFTGYTYHFDGYVLKTDSQGILSWSRTLGCYDFYDDTLSVQETTDGGYIFTGWTASSGVGSSDVWLIKLNSAGDMIWNRTYGGIGLDGGDCVQQTADEGFIIVGSTYSFDSGGNGDVWLIRTDADGNEQWNTSYGGSYLDVGKSVQQTRDGGYILTGATSSFEPGNDDVWLIKTDAWGNELWNTTFGGSGWDLGKSVTQTTDGGYFITGDSVDPVHGDLEIYLIQTDENGGETWTSLIDHNGKTDSASYGIQTQDDGYIITGETGEYNLAAVDVLVVKIEGINDPPQTPVITGPSSGKPGKDYVYSFTTVDPEENEIFYMIDWGDDTTSDWMGPFLSGEEVTKSHTWTKKGVYVIQAKARDSHGNEGHWGSCTVTMPCSFSIPGQWIFERMVQRFLNALSLLQLLLN